MKPSEPIRIWLEISHHVAFRVGGWAWVRADGAAVAGYAGGERRVDAERTALLALAAALKAETDAGRPVRLMTASPGLLAIPARIAAAQGGAEAPAENLELWAQAMTALKGVEVMRAAAAPGAPSAFAAAWAELARDKAKGGGFLSAIPKTNLAKAGV
ncbi:hypothetical protein [Phenylobacterium sp.]|jgi:hypothetical protein|uniref:hypothetical protein n=1 Tax=Phenylobacterium sp. TaxID=1871053 RepID=UPI002F938F73